MSADSASPMSVEALIAEFVRLAKELGTAYTMLPQFPEPTPERTAKRQELAVVAAQLTKRRPIARIRALFDHESKDVRAYAAGQFLDIDEDWAVATLFALNENMSTRQMMAICDHARRPPPARPTLQEMTIEQLAARFEDAGMRRHATRFCGDGGAPFDVELSNQIVGEIAAIVAELRSRGAMEALFPLLGHSSIAVRTDAGRVCLSTAPDIALPVLQAIAAGHDGIERDNASYSIDFWRGKFNPPAH